MEIDPKYKPQRHVIPYGKAMTIGVKVAFILVIALATAVLPIPGITIASRVMLGIFTLGALLWITEVIPPFATAIAIVVLQVYILGKPEGLLGLGKHAADDSYLIFLNPIASPVMVLFFGGFIMAIAASKHGLDKHLAQMFLKRFVNRPFLLLVGVIGVTATFSMFMSNTATTAMMASIIYPFAMTIREGNKFKKGLILAVPFAANIGGMATIIGTPPNAVAASILVSRGYDVNFLKWMMIGLPLAIVMLGIMGLLLWFLYPNKGEKLEMPEIEVPKINRNLAVVVATFVTTICMWLTEPVHRIPSAVVALLPILVFTLTGILGARDLKKVEWSVLILILGGLSLGVGMQRTGLAELFLAYIPYEGLSVGLVLLIVGLATVVISNFMSNTSTANILIPVIAALSTISPVTGAMTVALCASMAMSLPISTPPNAIAYGSGLIKTRDMVLPGTIVSLIGIEVVVGVMVYFTM